MQTQNVILMIWEYKLEGNKDWRFWGRGIGVGVEVGEVDVLDIFYFIFFHPKKY